MDPIFQWVSPPSMLQESSQHEQQRQSSSSLEDWSKERPSPMPQTGSIGNGSSSAMDISDFTTLGDLGGEYNAKTLVQHRALASVICMCYSWTDVTFS
jgi:hypothetical protein